MNLMKRRWLVLAASCLINLCIGALYAWSVFAAPMAEYLTDLQRGNGLPAVTTGSLAIVFSVANMVGPITMITGGRLVRVIGPRYVILIGGAMFGMGMLLSGFARNVPVLILGFGLCCGLAMGMAYGTTVSNCVKFFPDKKGLAGGLTTAAYGLSSVIVPLIANRIISVMDVTMAFKLLGISIVILVGLASIFVLPCPDGFLSEGCKASEPAGAEKADAEKAGAETGENLGDGMGRSVTWKEMIRDKIFYVMLVMLCCGAFMGMMIISQASPIAGQQIHMSVDGAAIAVSVLALFNTGGRILGGVVSDRLGRINTLTLLFAASILGLELLANAGEGSMMMFYAGICIVGLCFGGFMGIYPGFTSEQFGAKYSGVNYGIMFIGFAISGFFGPMMIGRIYLLKNTYVPAYFVAMGLAGAGLLLSCLYRRIEKCRRGKQGKG